MRLQAPRPARQHRQLIALPRRAAPARLVARRLACIPRHALALRCPFRLSYPAAKPPPRLAETPRWRGLAATVLATLALNRPATPRNRGR